MQLILASASASRAALLRRLQLPFSQQPADVDEDTHAGETTAERAERLSIKKAAAVAKATQGKAIVIGSDQVASSGGQTLHKPVTAERACEQLHRCRGQWASFDTGLCLWNTETNSYLSLCERYRVKFAALTDEQIEAYVRLDQPLSSAGSFKAESLGVTLFEQQEGRDPTALVGLPLIGLCELLRQMGLDPLTQRDQFA